MPANPSEPGRENSMLVSVVMPLFNAAKWVVTAIDNLEAQTYPDIELILVNDASQDDSVAVARERLAKGFKGD